MLYWARNVLAHNVELTSALPWWNSYDLFFENGGKLQHKQLDKHGISVYRVNERKKTKIKN